MQYVEKTRPELLHCKIYTSRYWWCFLIQMNRASGARLGYPDRQGCQEVTLILELLFLSAVLTVPEIHWN
jgi:hypothetical protein